MTENEIKVLTSLRQNQEGDNGDGFGCVYLPNCDGGKTRSFNGTLSSLEKKGIYRPSGDPCFGEVKLTD